ncbi:MAG: glucose-1-phosphate thymidylyltransferase RfbA [Bdellovibrionales bacterium]|nr:glucose-1-phosphate thymidylyltransferase RfbA [Bdellovibrionales bacterium]
MKGILLAGGSGTRLTPLTEVISKQLLPVYDKPTIYYPLSTLMLAGIREILIISTPRDLPVIENLLGSGEKLGLKLSYKVQPQPKGIAEAFLLGEDFISNSPVCLILGDNIFYGNNLSGLLMQSSALQQGAEVFAYSVTDPERYGVVSFDSTGKALTIEEKPKEPKSPWAVTGLYFYDHRVCQFAKQLIPSKRGELEITDLNKIYLKEGSLKVKLLKRGFAWLDTGSFDSLLSSSNFVQTIEARQGFKIACIEEIAFRKKFITSSQMETLANYYSKSNYGVYLHQVLKENLYSLD